MKNGEDRYHRWLPLLLLLGIISRGEKTACDYCIRLKEYSCASCVQACLDYQANLLKENLCLGQIVFWHRFHKDHIRAHLLRRGFLKKYFLVGESLPPYREKLFRYLDRQNMCYKQPRWADCFVTEETFQALQPWFEL